MFLFRPAGPGTSQLHQHSARLDSISLLDWNIVCGNYVHLVGPWRGGAADYLPHMVHRRPDHRLLLCHGG
jgi:hypothetical protein